MIKALKNLPLGKAVGTDKKSNEFIKYLPENVNDWHLELLNYIFVTEKTPSTWACSTTSMLYKKGDPLKPKNYRPITLLNHIFKLFTQIIQTRLYTWAEENGLIPESQAGFRQGRSCDDQIFCLNAAIQKKILIKKEGNLFIVR